MSHMQISAMQRFIYKVLTIFWSVPENVSAMNGFVLIYDARSSSVRFMHKSCLSLHTTNGLTGGKQPTLH